MLALREFFYATTSPTIWTDNTSGPPSGWTGGGQVASQNGVDWYYYHVGGASLVAWFALLVSAWTYVARMVL